MTGQERIRAVREIDQMMDPIFRELACLEKDAMVEDEARSLEKDLVAIKRGSLLELRRKCEGPEP